jgi:hypothetical protein
MVGPQGAVAECVIARPLQIWNYCKFCTYSPYWVSDFFHIGLKMEAYGNPAPRAFKRVFSTLIQEKVGK